MSTLRESGHENKNSIRWKLGSAEVHNPKKCVCIEAKKYNVQSRIFLVFGGFLQHVLKSAPSQFFNYDVKSLPRSWIPSHSYFAIWCPAVLPALPVCSHNTVDICRFPDCLWGNQTYVTHITVTLQLCKSSSGASPKILHSLQEGPLGLVLLQCGAILLLLLDDATLYTAEAGFTLTHPADTSCG